MRQARILAATAALLSALAAPALAQDPDAIVDPDSPSAKEYAIPLQQSRQEATGEKRAAVPQTAGTTAPLFGVGISVKQPKPQSRPRKRKPPEPKRADQEVPPLRLPPAMLRALAAPPDSGISEAALLGAGGGGALLAGILLGLALRSRSHD